MQGEAPSNGSMCARPRRVLIVDDHAVMRETLRLLLDRRGFEVVGEAGGAKAALEAVDALAPDAVVLDVNLPDGDGVDVCRALTRDHPALAVLLISADGDNGRRAGECDAVGFLRKVQLASADLAGLLGGAGAGVARPAAA
jgi:DNA-binding NarL/FixJ family response regulator